MMDSNLTIALLLVGSMLGLMLGLPIGRMSQRQDDRARRRIEHARNPDQRPRYRLLAN